MSISWAVVWPRGPQKLQMLAKTNCPNDWADLTTREASIMSISWVVVWPRGPRSSRRLQKPTAPMIGHI